MRLDVYLSDKKLFKSRNKASETVKKGLVEVDGKVIYKPSYEVDPGKKRDNGKRVGLVRIEWRI